MSLHVSSEMALNLWVYIWLLWYDSLRAVQLLHQLSNVGMPGLLSARFEMKLPTFLIQPQHLYTVPWGLNTDRAFDVEKSIHSSFFFSLSSLMRWLFVHSAESNFLACSIKRACLRLLLRLGVDRRCGRCYLSTCFLLCHMETIWSSPRKIQLAIASTRRSVLSIEARVSGIHISPLSGT